VDERAGPQRARVARLAAGELGVELLVELGIVERRVVLGGVVVLRGGGGEVVAVLAVALGVVPGGGLVAGVVGLEAERDRRAVVGQAVTVAIAFRVVLLRVEVELALPAVGVSSRTNGG
jgi:hypothetical protein